jgi:uncharacterized protein involved in outer membrane biogenesis
MRVLRKIALVVGIVFVVAVAGLAIAIATVDPNSLKPLITTRVASFSGRELKINGDLRIRKSLTPTVETSDVWFENAKWAKEPAFVTLDKIRFRIKLLDLLRGRVVLPVLEIDGLKVALEKDAEGKTNWQLTGASPAEAAAKTVLPEGRSDFPAIRDLAIRNSHVVYRVAGKDATTLDIREGQGHSDDSGVELDAKGTYQKRPATLKVDGDPIGRLWASDRPYPVQIKFHTGETPDGPMERFWADAHGTLTNAFDKGRFGLTLTVKGSDMAQLYPLAGVVLPKTPPYTLTGKLTRHADEWKFVDFKGRMGDSDLAGDLTIHTAADPPKMEARFVSERLDFDDLAGLVGKPSATGEGETASVEQKREAQQEKKEERVFPDEKFDLDRLHAMNVRATLEAKRVETKRIPIDNLSLTIALEKGVLRAKPARFQIGGGTMDLGISLDGDAKPIRAELDGELRNVPLSALFKSTAFKDESSGVVDGRAHLSSNGGSVRELAAHLDGDTTVAMSHGQVSHLLIELIGLDIFESLGLVIKGDEPIDIRCAIVKAEARDGHVNIDPLVFDTEDTKITGKGAVNLASEKIDLVVTPYPKDFSPFTLRSPLRIQGKLASLAVAPDTVGLGPGNTVKRVLSTTLSAIVGLLPPMDVVLGKDSPCRALMDEARDSMVEVSNQASPKTR